MPGIQFGTFIPPEALSDGPTLRAAAVHAIALARAGDSRKGLALALRARHQAQGLELERGELDALNAAAIVHWIRGDNIAAVAAAIDACELAVRLGERSGMGHALVTLASSAFALGALREARARLLRCLDQAVETGDRELEVRARTALGIVLGDVGEFEAAKRELCRARLLVERHHETTCPSRALSNLANLHVKRARRFAALGACEAVLADCAEADLLAVQALQAATERSNLSVLIDATAIRGRACDLRGEPREALAFLAEACRIGSGAKCRTALPWVLCERGRLHLDLGEPDLARRAYEEAIEVAAELRPTLKIEEACLGLARVEQLGGNELGERRWRERAALESADFEQVRNHTRRQVEAFFTGR